MNMQRKLTAGQFIVLAEIEPPKGVDFAPMIAHARRVADRVDAVVVPEMSNAVMKMSSLGGCALLKGAGLESVMQVCCRDRNRLALQADLLSAYALGISNVMVVPAAEPNLGDHHRARSVHDIDLLELLEAMRTLQEGRDLAGVELNGAPAYCIGAAVTAGVGGERLERELDEMKKKIAAGARYFVTQPVFDVESLSPFTNSLQGSGIRIIPTVLLLKSAGMARYIDQHLSDIHIPGELIARIQKARDKIGECLEIARELVSAIKDRGCGGVLLSTAGWEDKLPEILAGL